MKDESLLITLLHQTSKGVLDEKNSAQLRPRTNEDDDALTRLRSSAVEITAFFG